MTDSFWSKTGSTSRRRAREWAIQLGSPRFAIEEAKDYLENARGNVTQALEKLDTVRNAPGCELSDSAYDAIGSAIRRLGNFFTPTTA